ncbi:N-acetyltransferase [Gorillibacterium massiliense]|uniref:N-acetyltransferase n=1 Tax=Gorillibacterium massiliense TaxID=1280390 RepID=UPI0004B8DED5|nr:N-acetyltransferase [Gorillibacterium massiliense]
MKATGEVQTVVVCRKAVNTDLDKLAEIIHGYAEKGIMLPRSKEVLKYLLDTFVVAEADGELVGCGSLCQLGKDLVEIRSLGITDGFKGQGIGRMLVERLMEMSREMGISKVMALTYEVEFFKRVGFTVVNKEIFPEKVWTDCINCKKQHCCDEIAVLKQLV